MTMQPIIFFMFAGRQANMELGRVHLTRLLARYPGSELHLWDLTRESSDQLYLWRWQDDDPRVGVMDQFHPGHPIVCRGQRGRGHAPCDCIKHSPPYEKPWLFYANDPMGYRHSHPNAIYVKVDDDVIWMQDDTFDQVIDFLTEHPNRVASANVANNVVCAKHEPALSRSVRTMFGVGDPNGRAFDRDWWALHGDPEFALRSHRWLQEKIVSGFEPRRRFQQRPGEFVSINFVAMRWAALNRAARLMRGEGVGDERAIDMLDPWIISNFHVAHLAFGPQERDLSTEQLDEIRQKYSELTNQADDQTTEEIA